MIISSLVEYYDRKKNLNDGSIPLFGFENKEINYIITLDLDGNIVTITNTEEKKKKKTYLIPKLVKKGSKIIGNLLVDSQEDALGFPVKGKRNLEIE